MNWRLEYKPEDKWIGVYHKKKIVISFGDMTFSYAGIYYPVIRTLYQHVWICIIPCLPIHLWWKIKNENKRL